MNKQDEMILFRAFNTINAFQNDDTLNEFKETQEHIKNNPEYKLIDAGELRNYFINKYNIDIE